MIFDCFLVFLTTLFASPIMRARFTTTSDPEKT
jgi:hypothetical protein